MYYIIKFTLKNGFNTFVTSFLMSSKRRIRRHDKGLLHINAAAHVFGVFTAAVCSDLSGTWMPDECSADQAAS